MAPSPGSWSGPAQVPIRLRLSESSHNPAIGTDSIRSVVLTYIASVVKTTNLNELTATSFVISGVV